MDNYLLVFECDNENIPFEFISGIKIIDEHTFHMVNDTKYKEVCISDYDIPESLGISTIGEWLSYCNFNKLTPDQLTCINELSLKAGVGVTFINQMIQDIEEYIKEEEERLAEENNE